ncbi:acetate--CoA ligase family protein [Chloroflexota bacterium]
MVQSEDVKGMTARVTDNDQRDKPNLDYIFHPRSIAVAGVSAEPARYYAVEYYISPLLDSGYSGRIYPVHPRGGEVVGLPVYPSVKDIPGPVDHVISCISADKTEQLVQDCRDKGVKVVQFFTAGYSETGEPERIDLQNRLVEIARQSGMRLMGPNCMGIYYPRDGISFCLDYPREPGPIGLICQSGGNTSFIIRGSTVRGLRFSKAVSFGNACDINECDLLEYLADDPETRVIAAYIEGTGDGRRLRDAVVKAASTKPLVLLKGGCTEAGVRAAASHTGALAGADAVWDGLVRQAGAIRVYSVEEMIDMLVALLRLKPPRGRKMCLVGNTGGSSVMATDEMERAGLRLPPVPKDIGQRLKELVGIDGSMIRNPIDAATLMGIAGTQLLIRLGDRHWAEVVREIQATGIDGQWSSFNSMLRDWTELDLAVFHWGFDTVPLQMRDSVMGTSCGPMLFAAKECGLPAAVVFHTMANDNSWRASLELQQICVELGLPMFLSMRGAARAIRRLIDFSEAYPEKLAALQS